LIGVTLSRSERWWPRGLGEEVGAVSLSDQEKAAVFARVAPDVLEQGPATAQPPSRVQRSAHSWGLVVALVAALLGLGGWLYVDHHQTPSQQAATTVTAAWLNAMNARDLTALEQTTTGDWTWQSSGPHGQLGPFTGQQLESLVQADFDVRFRIDPLGRPVVSDDTQVAVAALVTGSPDSRGVLLFNLRENDGELKVAQVIWLPSR
jgi:hypothetical protein